MLKIHDKGENIKISKRRGKEVTIVVYKESQQSNIDE